MRQSWDSYFMAIARAASLRGSCDRARVGCVLVVGHRIIATGYNGASPGLPHCDAVGHDMQDGRCVRTLHAEENALLQCATYGSACNGATLYSTTEPCYKCTQKLHAAGIKKVVFDNLYSTMKDEDRTRIAALSANILFSKYTGD